MNKTSICLVSLVAIAFSCQSQKREQLLELWYNQPAKVWEEALPLGNATTGAMVFGGINREQFALNDHTLWSGYPNPGNQPKGPKILSEVREAIFAGDYKIAAELWKGMHGPYSARYLTMGDLLLNFDFQDSLANNYSRKLDLRTAISTVCFSKDQVNYKRESFVSFPDQMMAIKLSTTEKGKISFDASLFCFG